MGNINRKGCEPLTQEYKNSCWATCARIIIKAHKIRGYDDDASIYMLAGVDEFEKGNGQDIMTAINKVVWGKHGTEEVQWKKLGMFSHKMSIAFVDQKHFKQRFITKFEIFTNKFQWPSIF